MATHNQWGQQGEQLAVDLLRTKGYSIRHCNWHAGRKEIDIVAEKEGTLVIVEVKTRSNDDYGLPEEAVDSWKIKRLIASADAYIKKYEIDEPVRFDIISITGNQSDYHIEHLEDAFFPPLWV